MKFGALKLRFVLTVLLSLSVVMTITSQVPVERSKDKVIISGTPYYVHTVKKGETAYSVTRAYNVTGEELTKLNPSAAGGLKEGQTLRIPVRPEAVARPPQVTVPPQKRDESKYIYHTIKAGETAYSLSKTYGVTENELIDSNKGIDIYKLPIGIEIAVPRKVVNAPTQVKQAPQSREYLHRVEKGETFSTIADKYGISVRELRRANRDTGFPQVGGYVKIPGMMQPAPVVPEPEIIAEPVADLNTEPVIERMTGITEVKGLKGTFNVAVLLPFYIRENSQRSEVDLSDKSKTKKKVVFRSEDWIYPRSLDFIELYNGIMLAADTLRSLGIDINIYSYDIRSDTSELTMLLNSGRLAGMDLIIGPVYSYNLAKVAAYAKNKGIPVVSPMPLMNSNSLYGNPTLFLSNSSLSIATAQKKLTLKLAEYQDGNFILIHSDSTGANPDQLRFRNLLSNELGQKISDGVIKFREIQFYGGANKGIDSIAQLGRYLSDKSPNIIIISSEESPVISESMETIHSFSKKYDIRVYGYPVMRDIENLDPKYFFDLDVSLYYPFWIDYSKSNVKAFISDYRQKFLTEPIESSYAWHGYDLAWYFISGLAMQGSRFIENPGIHNPELLENHFDFVRDGAGNGYENQMLFFIRYTRDYEVKLVPESGIVENWK